MSNKNDSILSISTLTSFEWSDLYVFKPYTPIDEIHSTLGFEWEQAESTMIQHAEGFNLLVFVNDKRVVSFVKVPRNYGDFYRITVSGPFARDNSSFVVRKELFGGQPRIFLNRQ